MRTVPSLDTVAVLALSDVNVLPLRSNTMSLPSAIFTVSEVSLSNVTVSPEPAAFIAVCKET